jgi:hypothetical protein
VEIVLAVARDSGVPAADIQVFRADTEEWCKALVN